MLSFFVLTLLLPCMYHSLRIVSDYHVRTSRHRSCTGHTPSPQCLVRQAQLAHAARADRCIERRQPLKSEASEPQCRAACCHYDSDDDRTLLPLYIRVGPTPHTCAHAGVHDKFGRSTKIVKISWYVCGPRPTPLNYTCARARPPPVWSCVVVNFWKGMAS